MTQFKNVVILHESHCRYCQYDQDQSFQKILAQYEAETLEVEDWNFLKTCFFKNSSDASDSQSDDANHLFHNNKRCFEYNIEVLKDTETTITRLNAQHNNQTDSKKDSAESQSLKIDLYLCDGEDVMITSM